MNFKFWEPEVPSNDCINSNFWDLVKVTFGSHVGNHLSVPTFGNWKFFVMVTYGSHVENRKFQRLGNGSSWSWQPLVPTLGTIRSNLWELEFPCKGNQWFPCWENSFQQLGTGSCLQW